MTTVLVTHDQTEANALADRIAVMEDGELQQFESPTQLKHKPANIYVGTFIGEPPMNTFAAEVKPIGKGFQFQLEETGEILTIKMLIFRSPCAINWLNTEELYSVLDHMLSNWGRGL